MNVMMPIPHTRHTVLGIQ